MLAQKMVAGQAAAEVCCIPPLTWSVRYKCKAQHLLICGGLHQRLKNNMVRAGLPQKKLSACMKGSLAVFHWPHWQASPPHSHLHVCHPQDARGRLIRGAQHRPGARGAPPLALVALGAPAGHRCGKCVSRRLACSTAEHAARSVSCKHCASQERYKESSMQLSCKPHTARAPTCQS